MSFIELVFQIMRPMKIEAENATSSIYLLKGYENYPSWRLKIRGILRKYGLMHTLTDSKVPLKANTVKDSMLFLIQGVDL